MRYGTGWSRIEITDRRLSKQTAITSRSLYTRRYKGGAAGTIAKMALACPGPHVGLGHHPQPATSLTRVDPVWRSRVRPSTCPPSPQTMLTVLTQTPPSSVSGSQAHLLHFARGRVT